MQITMTTILRVSIETKFASKITSPFEPKMRRLNNADPMMRDNPTPILRISSSVTTIVESNARDAFIFTPLTIGNINF